MAEENPSIEVVKAGFKALLTVLIQIREGKNGEPTGKETLEASKLFSRLSGTTD